MTSTNGVREQHQQEEACARAFLNRLRRKRGLADSLDRAENVPEIQSRWDFVAQAVGHDDWIALEVKALVVQRSRRQFGDWDRFCLPATRELQKRGINCGTIFLLVAVPWSYSQQQGRLLLEAVMDALADLASCIRSDTTMNLGPAIASKFDSWPTKPPRRDDKFWRERGIWKVINPPEDLMVFIAAGDEPAIELGSSVGPVSQVDPELGLALRTLFDPKGGQTAKPNEQLREASQKGASETILLLDNHVRWKPDVIGGELKRLDQTLLSDIDSVYLVSATQRRVRQVWP